MSLFAKADAAMYRAKKNGKGQYCIYGAWKNRPEEQVVAREAQAILPRGYTQTENPLERELAHKEMVYRAALKEAHINVWEYDMRTRTLSDGGRTGESRIPAVGTCTGSAVGEWVYTSQEQTGPAGFIQPAPEWAEPCTGRYSHTFRGQKLLVVGEGQLCPFV